MNEFIHQAFGIVLVLLGFCVAGFGILFLAYLGLVLLGGVPDNKEDDQ